jgi:hypothetical protein
LACVVWAHNSTASAQDAGGSLLGRYEVTVGASWTGPASFGSRDASLTGAAGDRYRLFSTSSEVAAGPAFGVRFGRRLTQVVQIEIEASYSSPLLTARIGDDAEGGAATVASESIRQITVVGAAVVYLPRWWGAAHALPFVTAGGGYLRQLHEGDTLAQNGGTYFVGGGAMFPLASRALSRSLKQIGVRVDIRALIRSGDVAVDGRAHTSPAVTGSLFVRF